MRKFFGITVLAFIFFGMIFVTFYSGGIQWFMGKIGVNNPVHKNLMQKRTQFIVAYVTGMRPLDSNVSQVDKTRILQFYNNYKDNFSPTENYELMKILLKQEYPDLERSDSKLPGFGNQFIEAALTAYEDLECQKFEGEILGETIKRGTQKARQYSYCSQINTDIKSVVERTIRAGTKDGIIVENQDPTPALQLFVTTHYLTQSSKFMEAEKGLVLCALLNVLENEEKALSNWAKFSQKKNIGHSKKQQESKVKDIRNKIQKIIPEKKKISIDELVNKYLNSTRDCTVLDK